MITIGQLRACGLTTSAVAKRARVGRLTRIHRGVYVVGPGRLTFEGRSMAAVLAAGPGAFVTGKAAAFLLGLIRYRPSQIDVVSRRQCTLAGVRIRRSRSIDQSETSTRRGIPIATVPRMLVDLAEEMNKWELANVIHEAAYRGMVAIEIIERTIARHRNRRGHRTLVAAFDAWRVGGAGAMSRLELRALRMLEQAGVPEAHVNEPIGTLDGPLRVDLHWPDLRICAETDGHVTHGRPPTKRIDARRNELIAAAGFRLFRLREHTLRRDVDALVAAIRACDSSSAQPAPGAMPV